MWTRQELKEKGKFSFKANYWSNVLVAFVLGLLTAGASVSSSTQTNGDDQAVNDAANAASQLSSTQLAAIGGFVLVVIIVCILLNIFIWNPLRIGCFAFFKENVKHRGIAKVGILGEGFKDYGHKFITMFLKDLYLALWTCLFFIPGFIKYYSYRMVPFIVRDHPELSANEVITMSRKMMDGQKMNTFLLDLSFIGWFLLSIVTLGIVGIFWTNPYYQNTNAALYLRLNGEE